MGRIDQIYEYLAGAEDEAADAALLEVLGPADAARGLVDMTHVGRAVTTLLARGRPAGAVGLIARYHLMPPPVRHEIAASVERLFAGLRASIRHESPRVRRNAVDLIGESGDPRLAYLLPLGLHDPDPLVRQTAAASLHRMTARWLQRRASSAQTPPAPAVGPADSLEQDRNFLTRALVDALADFDVHLHTKVVEAAMWMADHLKDELFSPSDISAGGRTKLHHAISEVFVGSDDPRLAAFAYVASGVASMRPVVARALRTRRSPAFWEAMIQRADRLTDGSQRALDEARGLAAVKSPAWLEEGASVVLALPDELAERAVTLIEYLGLTAAEKLELLESLVLSGTPPFQRAALVAAHRVDPDGAARLLRTVAGWEDSELVTLARSILSEQPAEAPAEPIPTTAPGPPVWSFRRLWEQYDQLDDATRQLAAERLVDLPEIVLRNLRIQVRSSDPDSRLKAVCIARLTGAIEQLDDQAYMLAGDRDARVRSAAIAAMPRLGGPAAQRVCLRALGDPDARVVANAVEALDRMGAVERIANLAELAGAADNRVRTNAIAALLNQRLPRATEMLFDMLAQPDRGMRISAIWLISRTRLVQVTARLLTAARSDSDVTVRRRALEAIGELTHLLAAKPPAEPADAQEVAAT